MLKDPFRLEITPYWILLPSGASVCAEMALPQPWEYQRAATQWVITLGRFRIVAHLDATHDLGGLKSFIDYTTNSNVAVRSLTANGVPGVTHGVYGPPRTWIDWWFKKGDVMICLCLQSVSFPVATPLVDEIAEHESIIGSLKYSPDFPGELPPVVA